MIEPLDYETAHEFYLTVEATDGGTPSLSDMATVNINLTDVNDNSPIFNQDMYSAVISEDAELGKTVLTVSLSRCLFPCVRSPSKMNMEHREHKTRPNVKAQIGD